MSGREERTGYDIEVKRSQVEMEQDLIQRREAEARGLVPDITQLLYEGNLCGERLRYGFKVGKLYLSSERVGGYAHGYNIVIVRYKTGFFSKSVVLAYKIWSNQEMIEIKMFESGSWIECLVEAKSLSAERLIEYTRKRDEARIVATTLKRRERMKELGIDIDD